MHRMILPASIAAGLHVGLLFGIRPSPPPTEARVVPVKDDVLQFFALPPLPAQEKPVEIFDPGPKPPPPPPGNPVPRQQERYTLNPDTGGPKQILPPVPPGIEGSQTTIIPVNWPFGGEGAPITVVDPHLLDNPPRVLLRIAPKAPRDWTGDADTVTVAFVVGRDGRVIDARIVDGTDRRLEEACLRAVRRWRFEPGARQGVPVAFRVEQTFVFRTDR